MSEPTSYDGSERDIGELEDIAENRNEEKDKTDMIPWNQWRDLVRPELPKEVPKEPEVVYIVPTPLTVENLTRYNKKLDKCEICGDGCHGKMCKRCTVRFQRRMCSECNIVSIRNKQSHICSYCKQKKGKSPLCECGTRLYAQFADTGKCKKCTLKATS